MECNRLNISEPRREPGLLSCSLSLQRQSVSWKVLSLISGCSPSQRLGQAGALSDVFKMGSKSVKGNLVESFLQAEWEQIELFIDFGFFFIYIFNLDNGMLKELGKKTLWHNNCKLVVGNQSPQADDQLVQNLNELELERKSHFPFFVKQKTVTLRL